MKSPTVRPEVELLWVDATDNGMHLEFNTQMDGLSWPRLCENVDALGRIRAPMQWCDA